MTPESLFALASAQGIELGPDVFVPGATDGEWSSADIGLAARGLPRHPWLAALYTIAGDDSVHTQCMLWLMCWLQAAREQNKWATVTMLVSGEKKDLGRELVRMFLLEERCPEPFRIAPKLRFCILDVEEREWRRNLSHQYAGIHGEYDSARQDAERHIWRQLRRSA